MLFFGENDLGEMFEMVTHTHATLVHTRSNKTDLQLTAKFCCHFLYQKYVFLLLKYHHHHNNFSFKLRAKIPLFRRHHHHFQSQRRSLAWQIFQIIYHCINAVSVSVFIFFLSVAFHFLEKMNQTKSFIRLVKRGQISRRFCSGTLIDHFYLLFYTLSHTLGTQTNSLIC